MYSQTEENYIKAIHRLNQRELEGASTKAIAEALDTQASSVTDMLQKLSDKGLVHYQRYKPPQLTDKGKVEAMRIVRKHRLWETFLVEKLGFGWDEVHELAEELEHIRSHRLTDRLDRFLDHPRYDPHGDPIPDQDGRMEKREEVLLTEIPEGETARIVGVRDSSAELLRYLDRTGLILGTHVKAVEQFQFDGSRLLEKEKGERLSISYQVAQNLYVKPEKGEQ
ncbi:MAG: metal-dependent transcriptional regulator [Flavobacteriales bacterium]